MEPLSNEIREKIVKHKQAKETEKNIAKWLIISESSVAKIWSLFKKTGSFLPLERTQGRKPMVSEDEMQAIVIKIKQQPDVTLLDLIEEFHLKISDSALSKRLKKLGYTYKKRLFIQKNKKD